MIIPFSIVNKILSRKVIWIQGENRSGKSLLTLDISEYFLRSGWRLISNLNCVWNDSLPLELDSNLMLNAVVILDEAGVSIRTKESIRLIMGAKGKLGTVFLLPSTEAPHEDLWGAYIEPHKVLNEKFITPLFGHTFYENYFKIWRFVEFDVKTGFKTTLFFQIHPKAYHYIYSTLSFGSALEDILSQFQKSLLDQNTAVGNENLIGLYDVATKRTGAAEATSFINQQIVTRAYESERKLFSTHSKRK